VIHLSPTLSTYFGRVYLGRLGLVLSLLLFLSLTIDIVELLRRAGNRPDLGFSLLLKMSLLKLPSLGERLLPFALLFGGMLSLTRLTRTNELVVARAAGVSVWQFLAPTVFLAFLIGTLVVTVVNPIASALLSRYEQLDAKFMRGRTSSLALSSTGLWLREADREGQVVVHALRVAQQGVELNDAIFFFFEGSDRFVRRIDAKFARLQDGSWQMEGVLISSPDRPAQSLPSYEVPTTLTFARINDSFASPETLSFWALPGFIDTLEQAGFSAVRHRLHLHALLALPMLLFAMGIIAATFSLRLTRRGGTGLLIAGGVLVGFVLYFFSELVQAAGQSGTIPVTLAAWSPAGVSVLLGLATLLHLEDG
jgi:lipopolysaccharide export system permease protein